MSRKVLHSVALVALSCIPLVAQITAPPAPSQSPQPNQVQVQVPPSGAAVRLTVQDAEALALKNNPQISVYRLLYLASKQVTRQQQAAY
ncbi:MAG TPA: hypothetical protein VN620_17180, partial [Candidatus Methylomirabilis sp.]|nr:hypothetical protein [Candidatus Methylomirabilis sp.]